MADFSKGAQVGRRYVEALLSCIDEKTQEHFSEEASEFLKAAQEATEINQFLKNPIIDPNSKAEIFFKIFPRSSKSKEVQSFFHLICENRREELLPILCQLFEEKYYETKGQAICLLSLPRPVSTQVMKTIQSKLSQKFNCELVMKTKIDPSLIAGFKAEVRGNVIDASTLSQVDRLKGTITAGLSQI